MTGTTMDIYSSEVSPFGTRVLLGAAAKGRRLSQLPLPEGGVRSDAFRRINPLGKIPVLVAEDGQLIAESAAILGYLEHRFADPSLLPAAPAARARMDAACRAVDLYLMTPVTRLFRQLAPDTRDAAAVADEVGHWTQGAMRLKAALDGVDEPVQAPWSMLDCVLAPSLHLSRRIAAMLDLEEDPASVGGLADHYDGYLAHAGIGPVLNALTAAQEAYDLKAGRPSVAARH